MSNFKKGESKWPQTHIKVWERLLIWYR